MTRAHLLTFILSTAAVIAFFACGDQRSRSDGDGDADADECGDERSPLDIPPAPIVNGSESWDPAVVDLTEGQALAVGAVMTNNGGNWSNGCTGTLVAPQLVVTAAHCVIDIWTGAAQAPEQLRFALGDDAASPVHTFMVAEVGRHPEYRRWAGSAEHDIGVMVLTENALEVLPEIEPIPVNCEPLEAESFVGQDVQNVGYGLTEAFEWGSPPPPDNSLRFWTVEEAVELTGFDFVVDGHGVSAVCNGDSGGPSLWTMPDDAIRVVGTVSWGDSSCVDLDHFARVDDSCAFISEYLEGCGDVTAEGSCEGSHAVYCEGGTVIDVDCAASGRVCGDNGAGRMRCIDDSGPCGGETFEGRCDVATAVWCEDDAIIEDDCGDRGENCGVTAEGLHRCVEGDPCDGLDWAGRCEGDDAVWCRDGELRVRRCDDCGQLCGWVDEMGGFYCI